MGFLETGDALWTVQLSEDTGRVPQVVERRQVDLAMMREQCRSLHCNEFDKDAVEFRTCEAMSRNEQKGFDYSADRKDSLQARDDREGHSFVCPISAEGYQV